MEHPSIREQIRQPFDVVIAGGTAAGVALALAAAGRGLRVFLAGSRPYLGEDLCGDMRFWEGEDRKPASALGQRLYGAESPVRPMHVKLSLEQSLVEAGVPFLLNTHGIGLLRDADGRYCGIEAATRSGVMPLYGRLLVDASTEGVLTRMAGKAGAGWPSGKQRVLHRTLSLEEGSDAEGIEIIGRPTPIKARCGDHGYSLSARTYSLEVDFGRGRLRDLMRAEAEIVLRCWTPGEFAHQERIRLLDTERSGSGRIPDPGDLPLDNGFLSLSPAAAGDPDLQRGLRDPIGLIDAVEQWGPWLGGVVKAASPEFETFPESQPAGDELDSCDVLVLGGGTGGAPAAISAARAGADTVVVESMDQLGGVGTAGQISRYWFGNRVGFTSEIDAAVASLETDPKLRKNLGQWSVSAKSHWYLREAMKGGATVLFRSLAYGVETKGNRLTGLHVATPFGAGLIRSGCMVDASGCADAVAAAGGPTREITAEHVAVQGTGLAGVLPGNDYNNSDHNFSDDTDVFDTTAFLVSTKLKYHDHFDAGQLVDSRERRQIIGDLVLGPSDFLSKRTWPDTICVASSNFDSHGYTIHPVFMCKPPDKKRLWADVPLRALLPRGLERVLVTGLGVSAHRDALPVIRMQADVQNQGFAAGYAAACAAQTGTDLRKLSIRDIQRKLCDAGIVPDRVLEEEDSFPVADDRLRRAVAEGWDDFEGLALIFAEAERTLPLLREAIADCPDGDRKRRYALILGLLSDETGKDVLAGDVAANEWDEGWNYTGMGQFGMSLSPLDASLIALAKVGDSRTWPLLLDKIRSLPVNPDLSHCRAVAEACEALYARFPDAAAAPALAACLERAGLRGHAQRSISDVQEAVTDNPNENAVRNQALRELHLARALYRCGDHRNLGKTILDEYATDMRAHFAKHARAVLNPEPQS